MRSRAALVLAFIVFLIPSAQFAWRNADMPDFGRLHDDAVMFVTAQSIAQGHGYRIPSLPENPYQTKYPPLFPAYLSLAWMLNPSFPGNLATATVLIWPWLVVFLALAWALYRQDGFPPTRALLLTAALGLSPYMVLFGSLMLSEVFFTCFLLAALLLARRPGNGAILLAGLAAACAYLTRSAGIALIVSIPAVLLWKRDGRRAALFLATSLPAVVAWSWWSRAHLPHSNDMSLLYYLDYMAFEKATVGWDNFWIVLWKNIDQILYGMGSLVLPKVVAFLPLKILTQMIAVAMLSGVVRLVRRGIAVDYAAFGLLSVGILAIWHYPPNERFVLPLFPLLLGGLLTELDHLVGMLRKAFRHKDTSQRVAAGMFAAGVAALVVAAVGLQVYMCFVLMPETAKLQRKTLAERRAAYQWMAANLPSGSSVLSYDDPQLYLYSGHRGNYRPMLPRWWYAEDHTKIVNAYRDLGAYCKSRGLGYVYFTTEDMLRETDEDDRKAIEQLVRSSAALTPLYSAGIGTLYRVCAKGCPNDLVRQAEQRAAPLAGESTHPALDLAGGMGTSDPATSKTAVPLAR